MAIDPSMFSLAQNRTPQQNLSDRMSLATPPNGYGIQPSQSSAFLAGDSGQPMAARDAQALYETASTPTQPQQADKGTDWSAYYQALSQLGAAVATAIAASRRKKQYAGGEMIVGGGEHGPGMSWQPSTVDPTQFLR